MHGKWLWIGIAMAIGCAGDVNSGDDSGSGTADHASEVCLQGYSDWLREVYVPAVTAEPLSETRVASLEELALEAPCHGGLLDSLAESLWFEEINRLVYGVYAVQREHALQNYLFLGSPTVDDHAAYVRDTTPAPELVATARVLQAARPLTSAGRVEMQDWLETFEIYAQDLSTPFSNLVAVPVEGLWTLSAGESQFFDLLVASRPVATHDGAFAAWVEAYDRMIRTGLDIGLTEDDFFPGMPRQGCFGRESAPCSRDRVLDRMAALAPTSHGAVDAAVWMRVFEVWAFFAAQTAAGPEKADYLANLERMTRVRPATLQGSEAYRTWLIAVAGTAVADRSVFVTAVVPAKPCVDDGLTDYVNFVSDHPELSAEIQDAAAPIRCTIPVIH
jgi:hypothetical protein